jgi:hypothetical protein
MRILGTIGCAAILAALHPSAHAQAATERTDLTGTWTNASLTALNRPLGVDKLVLSKAEADEVVRRISIAGFAPEGSEGIQLPVDAGAPEAGSADFGVKAYDQFWVAPGEHLAQVKGELRSSYIVDPPNGRMPIRTDLPQRAASNRYVTGIGGNEGPEAPPLSERCLIGFGNTGGPGMMSTLYNNTYQFVQAPDHVMILVEMVHDVRIVPTYPGAEQARAAHRPDAIKPWLGDSVGWYENGALIVETTNIRPDQVRASSIPISATGRMTERFERVGEGEIFYSFVVDDPATYTQPWKAELSFYASKEHVYEYACHEGNYAMEGILGGARLQEEAAATAANSQGKTSKTGKTR